MKKVYKHYAIYKITNIKNGKIYIGMHRTNDLNDDYMGSGKRIRRSIQYHGIENFIKEILFDFDDEQSMIEKEIELVNEEFIKRDDTYNLNLGGKGSWHKANLNFSESKRKEIGIKGGKALKQKIKNDKKFFENWSKKSSITMKKTWKEGKLNYYDWTGKKHTEETKSKMRETKKRNKFQVGEKNSQFGTMWITNGIDSKKIKRTDFIPNGWEKGRKLK